VREEPAIVRLDIDGEEIARSVRAAMYDPLGSVFGGPYDQGGPLPSGLTLVWNPPPFRKRLRRAWRILRGKTS
jgi:hypothetical protein